MPFAMPGVTLTQDTFQNLSEGLPLWLSTLMIALLFAFYYIANRSNYIFPYSTKEGQAHIYYSQKNG